MSRLDSLRSAPEDVLGSLYERLVLDALGLPEAPLARWTATYARLSEALTARRAETLSAGASGTWNNDDDDARAVAAFVFGQRTFLALRRIFAAYPLPPGPRVDWGAGSGAAALAATMDGGPIPTLIDAAPTALALARRVFHAAGLEARTADALPRASSIIAALSLNEWRERRRASDYADLVRTWLHHVGPGGRVYVLEPGLLETSRVLQTVREKLRHEARILAPCTHFEPCPLLPRSHDWCHMTWRLPLGSAAQAIIERAGHDASRIAFSWLILESATPLGTQESRVLQVRGSGKGKTVAHLCHGSGYEVLVGLTRGAVGARFAELQAGEVVTLDRAFTKTRGDGTRAEDPAALIPSRTL